MCGRFFLDVDFDSILSDYDLAALAAYYVYNGERFPNQPVLTIVSRHGQLKAVPMSWGIKTPYFRRAVINARSETIAQKSLFRTAIENRRLLVPASGYYEWQERSDGLKQKYRIALKGRPYFNFAGVFNVYQVADQKVAMAVIITLDAAPQLAAIHPRMPMILPRDAEWRFLYDELFDINQYRRAVYEQDFTKTAIA